MKGMGISKFVVILLLVSSSCIDALDMDPTLDVNGVTHTLSSSDISELTEEMKNAAQNHGFVMNRGQLGIDEVKYYTRAPTGGISFCTSSVVITVKEPITSEIWMNYPEAFESTSSGFEPILPSETRMRACNVLYLSLIHI